MATKPGCLLLLVGGVVIVAANRLMRFLKKSSTGSTYRVGSPAFQGLY